MYTLYFDKKNGIIEIKKANQGMQRLTYTDDVIQYNDCYFICAKRNMLIEKAMEIKQIWIKETKELLDQYENIEIK